MRATRRTLIVVAVVLILALGGLLLLPIGDAPAEPEAVTVSMVDDAFLPAVVRAPDGVLDLSNDGAVTHSFLVLDLAKGTELPPGGSITLDLSGSPSGTYEVICDIPGHREAGMVATLQLGEAFVGEPDP